MHDRAAMAAPGTPAAQTNPRTPSAALYRRYPTIDYLRRDARRHVPHFGMEYADNGAGKDDAGIKRNWAALDAIELVPRYGVMPALPPCDVELFGQRYAAPIGIAPMGMPAVVWPGADLLLARAAQRAGIPYTLGMAGAATIEQAAAVAPDVCWFQLYRVARDDHAVGFDLVRRAAATACKALVLTLDVPVRTTRAREVAVGLGGAFHPSLKMLAQMARKPRWTLALWKNGVPRFESLRPYAGAHASIQDAVRFAQREMIGAFTWDEVARYRDRWRKPLLVKGILHPQDAERAVALGVDGVIVSNHGGRQIEALPATIDALPAIVKQVGTRATVLMDSGIRSGTDVVRACALGAVAAFAGKAFLWGFGALGEAGPSHVIDLLIAETQAALGQLGARRPEEVRSIKVRHAGALQF